MTTRTPGSSSNWFGKAYLIGVLLFLVMPPSVSIATANDLTKARESIKKKAKRVERDLNKILKDAGDLPDDVLKNVLSKKDYKNVKKAVEDTFDAVEAAGRYAGRQLELPGKTLERSMHKKNPVDSLAFLATNPIKQTDEHAIKAVTDSAVLGAGAQLAASIYGGPSGAAAYAAWITYHATGGDIEAALKQGAITGVTAALAQSISTIDDPISREAARVAFKAAQDAAAGKDIDDVRDQILPALISTLSEHIPTEDLSLVQRTAATAAIGGAVVAASGGSQMDVERAFLRTGAKVVVQEVGKELKENLTNAKNQAKANVVAAIPKEQLADYNQKFDQVKADHANAKLRISEAAKKLTSNKAELEARAKALKSEILKNPEIQAVTNAKAVLQAQAKQAQQLWQQAHVALKREAAHLDKQLNTTRNFYESEMKKKPTDEALVQRYSELVNILEEAQSKLTRHSDQKFSDIRKKYKSAVANAEEIVQSKARFTFTGIIKEGNTNARVLRDGMVLSWDLDKLKWASADNPAIFLTYAEQISDLASITTSIDTPQRTKSKKSK